MPFLLSTDAHVWNAVRTGTPDPRLAAAAVERQPADHVILVTSVAGAVGARTDVVGAVVVTDADAAAGGVAAASAWPDVLRLLQRLHREDDGACCCSAEFLVRECLPLERVLLIAVGNDRVRDRVRAALDAVGSATRVAVYPPWFQPTAPTPNSSPGAATRRTRPRHPRRSPPRGGLLEERALRLLDAVEVREPVRAVVAEDPVAVEQEPERRAEREADDVRGDVVGEQARVARASSG